MSREPCRAFGAAALLLAAAYGAESKPVAYAKGTTVMAEYGAGTIAFCAQGVEKTLKENPATADVVVSLENRLVAIATKAGQDIADADLTRALTDAGYTVKSIARTQTPIAEIREQVRKKSK
jgi:copper chaperone CopZ